MLKDWRAEFRRRGYRPDRPLRARITSLVFTRLLRLADVENQQPDRPMGAPNAYGDASLH
jgi:hypothetical protein